MSVSIPYRKSPRPFHYLKAEQMSNIAAARMIAFLLRRTEIYRSARETTGSEMSSIFFCHPNNERDLFPFG
jgi:hypothetical protein